MSRTPESRRSFLVSILSRAAGTYVVATAGLSGIASFVTGCAGGAKYGGPVDTTYGGRLVEEEPKPAPPSATPSTTTTAAAQTTSSSPPPDLPATKYGGPPVMHAKYGGPRATPKNY